MKLFNLLTTVKHPEKKIGFGYFFLNPIPVSSRFKIHPSVFMKQFLTSVTFLLTVSTIHAQTDSAEIYFQKGMNEKNTRLFMAASADFNKAIDFDARYKDAYRQDAAVNMEMHRTDNAKADLEKVYQLDPADNDAIKQLTTIYFEYHQYQQALDFANQCQTCDNAERVIGLCSYQEENYEDAIRQLTNVIRKDPTDAEATYTIARSYLELEEYIKAVPYYQKAVMLDPTKNVWMYELGLLYYNNNDYKDAVVLFDKAATAGYNQSSDYNENLGFACVYSGNFERGEKILLTLLSRRPNNTDLLRGVADAYYKHGMYDKSLEFCQQLMMLDAKDGNALYQAGMCFQKKGEKDKGQQMCDKAIEMDPSLASLRQKQMTAGL
jgi:tetratricopeptide (TPR) repeat protein